MSKKSSLPLLLFLGDTSSPCNNNRKEKERKARRQYWSHICGTLTAVKKGFFLSLFHSFVWPMMKRILLAFIFFLFALYVFLFSPLSLFLFLFLSFFIFLHFISVPFSSLEERQVTDTASFYAAASSIALIKISSPLIFVCFH